MIQNYHGTVLEASFSKHFLCIILAILLILLVIISLYLPVSEFSFLNWDDDAFIHLEPMILKGLSIDGLSYAFSYFENPYFMPLTRISYMLDITLFGLNNPGGFHVTNMILHSINTVLIFLLVFRASSRYWVALFIALLWGVHPEHIEAVAWVAERKEVLAGTFGLGALLCYQQYTLSLNRIWYLCSILTFFASIFCKPAWITFPVLLLLWDYFPLQRFNVTNGWLLFREKIPFFIISGIFTFIFIQSLYKEDIITAVTVPQPELWEIGLLLFEAIGKYFTDTFIPLNLVPFVPYPEQINMGLVILCMVLLCLIFRYAWQQRNQYPGLLMAMLWFLVALSPAMTLIISPTGEAIFTGNRFTYLPHLGLFTGLAFFGLNYLADKKKEWLLKSVKITGVVGICLAYGVSYATLPHWKSSESLWRYTVEHLDGRDKVYPLEMLGSTYFNQKDYGDALQAFKECYRLRPESFKAPLFIGDILWSYGQYDKGVVWHDKMLTTSPAPAGVLFVYGENEYKQARYLRAEQYLLHAAKLVSKGDLAQVNVQKLYLLLGLSQGQNSKYQAAANSLYKARLTPIVQKKICTFLSQTIFDKVLDVSIEKKKHALLAYCQLDQD